MTIVIVPSNMFLYTQNGILGREVHINAISGAGLWIENFNLKIGVFDDKANFTSIEYYISELYYWYKYECAFDYSNTDRIPLLSINCLYYRKININGVEHQFNGRFPHHIDLTHPRITPDIRIYLSLLGYYIVQHLIFLLNLYTPNDRIEMTGLTALFLPIVDMYLNYLDQNITASNDSLVRLITTLNFNALEKLVSPTTAERIMEYLLKYLETPGVIQQLPLNLCLNLILAPENNKKRYIFRDELTKLARKNKRTELSSIMIPSPLRKHS